MNLLKFTLLSKPSGESTRLAKRLKVSKSLVSRWVNGTRNIDSTNEILIKDLYGIKHEKSLQDEVSAS